MRERVIGASMSEPHTSVLNRNVCMCVCLSVSYVLVVLITKFHVSAPYDGTVEGAVHYSRNFLDFLIAKVRV